jgi:hypothetical protein
VFDLFELSPLPVPYWADRQGHRDADPACWQSLKVSMGGESYQEAYPALPQRLRRIAPSPGGETSGPGHRLATPGDHVPEVPSFVFCATMIHFGSIW